MATLEEKLEAAEKQIEKLQSKLQSANTESGDRRDENKKLQLIVDAKSDIDVDKYKAALKTAEKAGNDKLLNEGKVAEIEAKVRDEVTAEFKPLLDKVNERLESTTGRYRTLAIDNPLLEAAASHKAVKPDVVVKLLRDSADIDDDGKFIAKVNGHRALNKDGDPMTANEFVGDWLSKPENAYMNPATPGGAGSGTVVGDGGDGGRTAKQKIADGLKAAGIG